MNEPIAKTKTCRFCERELTLDHFNKSARAKDGYQCYCRECQSLMNKERNAKLKAEAANAPKEAEKPATPAAPATATQPPMREKSLADFEPREIFLYLESIGYRWGANAIWREKVVRDYVIPSTSMNR